jgi:nitrate reductase gamma subunit
VHALIVWPFVLRFLWGIVAWAGSHWAPRSAWPWIMLDKNGWANGIFFDLTGLVVVAAVAVAVLHGRSQGAAARMPGMPRHDWLSSGLLGAVVLAGFLLEGVRIAMTGYPPDSGFAFVGDAISRFFHRSAGLEDIYAAVWYTHAVLTGLFVAWLPFSRMFHIVLAPVLLAVNAADCHRSGSGRQEE